MVMNGSVSESTFLNLNFTLWTFALIEAGNIQVLLSSVNVQLVSGITTVQLPLYALLRDTVVFPSVVINQESLVLSVLKCY